MNAVQRAFWKVGDDHARQVKAMESATNRLRSAVIEMLDDLQWAGVQQKIVAAKLGISASRISEIRDSTRCARSTLPRIYEGVLQLWERHCAAKYDCRRVNASKTTDWIGGGK